MKLVELWAYGPEGSTNYIIIEPSTSIKYRVINGEYDVIPDKDNNKITVVIYNEVHEARYLGDIKWIPGEGNWDRDCSKRGYNLTINAYKDTKEIVGKNLIPRLEEEVVTKHEEPPF